MRNREVRKPVSVVPAANATYDVKLPAGHYWLSMHVKSNLVDGESTTIQVIPYVDKAAAQISSLPFEMLEANDVATVDIITLTDGAVGRSVIVVPAAITAEAVASPIYCTGVLQVAVVKGNGVAAETLEILLVATRVG